MTVEMGIVISLVGLAGTVIAALWRVGSVGKSIGTTLAHIEAQLKAHDERIKALEKAQQARVEAELATLRAEVARLRQDRGESASP